MIEFRCEHLHESNLNAVSEFSFAFLDTFCVVKAYSWQFEELDFHDQTLTIMKLVFMPYLTKTYCVNICSEGIQDGVTYWCMKILSKT